MTKKESKEDITDEGYIDDDIAIAHKKVGDSPNVGIVKDGDINAVMFGQPSFVIHPITKKRVNIKDIFKTDRDTKCPKCNEMNEPGVIFRLLESGEVIYECPKCKHYTFCKIK